MSDQTPPDAYGQVPPRPQQPDGPPPPGAPPPGYQYPPSGYGQHYPGYAPPAPRKPVDLPKLVFIAAWVVLGLYGLWFIYTLTQDDFGADFGDRLFGSLQNLATGIFYTAVLLAVSVWLGKQTTTD